MSVLASLVAHGLVEENAVARAKGEREMADWTKEEKHAAGVALSWRLGTSVQPKEIVALQCEATALREALEEALPLLKEELETLKRSFLPSPDKDESDLLVAYTQSTETIQGLLIRIPK
jgi:hypothetical protein